MCYSRGAILLKYSKELMCLIAFDQGISISKIGAAKINVTLIYTNFIKQLELANLYRFDGDERQMEKTNSRYGLYAIGSFILSYMNAKHGLVRQTF